MTFLHKGFTVALLAAALVAVAPTAAGADQAQVLFDRGVADLEAGRFETACPAIEESYKLDPRPGTLFTLAECEAKRGRLATAVKRYDEYLALFATLATGRKQKQGDRAREAREAKATLAPLVPELTISLVPGAPRTTITLDGAPLADAVIGTGIPVDPGEHVVAALAAKGPITRRVTLERNDRKAVLLDPRRADLAGPTSPPPGTPEASGPSGMRIAGIALGAAGAGAVIGGAIAGILAIKQKSVVDGGCGSGIGSTDATACNADGLSAAHSLKTLGTASTALLVSGAAVAAVGVVLVVRDPKVGPATASHDGAASGPKPRPPSEAHRGLRLGVMAGPGGGGIAISGEL